MITYFNMFINTIVQPGPQKKFLALPRSIGSLAYYILPPLKLILDYGTSTWIWMQDYDRGLVVSTYNIDYIT